MALAAVAAGEEPFQERWEAVRKAQPPGLTLTLQLPKTNFYQGEVITATLTFANTSTNRFHLWIGTYDRSGRITDIAFHGQSKEGQPVADPLAWYLARGGFGGGLGGHAELGQWSITLPANQWLRFDKPGTYQIYAWSDRPTTGGRERPRTQGTRTPVVSDIVAVQILPLDPAREGEIIAEAQKAVGSHRQAGRQAAEVLRYLQTPAARGALLPLLQGEHSSAASMGLIGAPDPAAQAPMLLETCRQPGLAITPRTIRLYATLKCGGLPRPPNEPQWELWRQANKTARRDFIAAVRSTIPAKQGEALLTSALTLLAEDPHDAQLRALLVDHQQDLTKAHIEQIVDRWKQLGGEDLLPIVRTAARPPRADPSALGLLARLAPDEARALIIEDLSREKPLYLDHHQGRYDLKPLEALPDSVLPELDEVLRGKLRAKDGDLPTVLPLIARYATTNLLPDVVSVYREHEGRWACEIQNSALRYWIRCDPPQGVEALARALKSRAETGCYRTTLADVLLNNWAEEALPAVLGALEDDNAEVVESAVRVLERNAPSEVIPKVLAAIGRLPRMQLDDEDQGWRAEQLADLLLSSKRWRLTLEQLGQLADSVPPGRKREIIRRRLSEHTGP
ncbi:hypothetical protein HQ590_13045 [bacterium]|nr:hypothetical protein [bacterium]